MAVTKAQGRIEIFLQATGVRALRHQTESVFKGMSGRASYYAGMIQSRLGYAFLGAAAAIAGFAALSIKKFGEFDQAMMNTASVTNATQEQMSYLRDEAMRLGKVGSASAKEVADAMYFLGSAGYNVGEIFKAIEPVMLLAVATQSEMSDTARILMQTLKAFGKEAKDATHFAQVFAAGISSSQLRLEWLGASMKHLGPVAHAVGMSIEETTAALAMLHDVGIQAGMAGRHLRRMIQGTIKDTKQARDTLGEYGLKLSDIDIKAHGFANVMRLLHVRQVKLVDVFKLFGLRASASGAALVKSAKSYKEYVRNVSDALKLQEMFNKQMQGLVNQFKRLSNVFGVFMMKFAEPFIPLVRAMVRVLTLLFDRLSEMRPWVFILMGLTAVFSAISLAVLGLAMILRGLLTQGLLSVGLLLGILKSTLVGTGKIIINMAKYSMVMLYNKMFATHFIFRQWGIVLLKIKTLGMIGFFKKLAVSIASVGTAAIVAWAKMLWPLLAVYAAAIGVVYVLDQFAPALRAMAKWFGDTFDNLAKGLKDFVDKVGKRLVEIQTFWRQVLDNIFGDVKAWIENLFTNIERWIQNQVEKLGVWGDVLLFLARRGLNKVKEPFVKFADFIHKWAPIVALGTEVALKRAAEAAYDWGVKTIKNIRDVTKDLREAQIKVNKFIADFAASLFGLLPIDKIMDLRDKLMGLFDPDWEEDETGLYKGYKFFSDYFKEDINYLKEDFEKFAEGIEKQWTNTIFDLVKGIKTWEEVWQMVLDDALKTFIHGFVKGMLDAWGQALARMVWSMHSTTADLGGMWMALLQMMGIGTGGGGLQGLKGKTFTGDAFFPGMGTPATYQRGTRYVPQNQLAYLHRGEAVIPASENRVAREITIVNVVDPSFVQASIARDPNVIINVINDDVIMAGATRRTMRRYLR